MNFNLSIAAVVAFFLLCHTVLAVSARDKEATGNAGNRSDAGGDKSTSESEAV